MLLLDGEADSKSDFDSRSDSKPQKYQINEGYIMDYRKLIKV